MLQAKAGKDVGNKSFPSRAQATADRRAGAGAGAGAGTGAPVGGNKSPQRK